MQKGENELHSFVYPYVVIHELHSFIVNGRLKLFDDFEVFYINHPNEQPQNWFYHTGRDIINTCFGDNFGYCLIRSGVI